MPTSAPQSNSPTNDGQPPITAPSDEIPAWLATRRDRQEKEVPAADTAEPFPQPETKPPAPVPPFPPRQKKIRRNAPAINIESSPAAIDKSQLDWWTDWFSKQNLIGLGFSLTVHLLILTVLAFILVSAKASREVINLFGALGDSDEIGADFVLDTAMTGDPGDSSPLQISDMTSNLDSFGPDSENLQTVRLGLGGKGNGTGTGEGGDGMSVGVPSLKIPGHAQTKGSFSAWAEPRAPKAEQPYFIVIQVRVPRNIKKYRASDLTTSVVGTDGYRQKNRFKSNDVIEADEGIVEIRVHVPGGQNRVRDTVEVESKLLHEIQKFEIQFLSEDKE